MNADLRHMIRVNKRLNEAAGYLELGMARHALNTLEGLAPLGPFEAEAELLRGEALRCQNRFADAAAAVQLAARKLPAADDASGWLALSLCYHLAGDPQKAMKTLALARGAKSKQETAQFSGK